MLIRRREDWLTAAVDGELIMMSAASGDYLGLCAVGARIWDLIATPTELGELCRALVHEYEVTPDACRADVESFICELSRRGAVTIEPGVGDGAQGDHAQ